MDEQGNLWCVVDATAEGRVCVLCVQQTERRHVLAVASGRGAQINYWYSKIWTFQRGGNLDLRALIGRERSEN